MEVRIENEEERLDLDLLHPITDEDMFTKYAERGELTELGVRLDLKTKEWVVTRDAYQRLDLIISLVEEAKAAYKAQESHLKKVDIGLACVVQTQYKKTFTENSYKHWDQYKEFPNIMYQFLDVYKQQKQESTQGIHELTRMHFYLNVLLYNTEDACSDAQLDFKISGNVPMVRVLKLFESKLLLDKSIYFLNKALNVPDTYRVPENDVEYTYTLGLNAPTKKEVLTLYEKYKEQERVKESYRQFREYLNINDTGI